MRQIKFRAWDERKKEMFQVDVLAISPCTWDCPEHDKRGVSLAYQPSTPVMQFTGLLDREGVEVFEGDVVKAHYFYFNGNFDNDGEIIGVVRYSDWCAWGIGVVSGGGGSKWFGFLDTSHFDEPCIEVIGNIHQNPELLK